MHDDYKQLATQLHMEPCPCCSSPPQLWQYSTSETSPTQKVVMCSYGEPIGPRIGGTIDGCLLSMPPQDFYRETAKDAVGYWNAFAKAQNFLRRNNNWKNRSALRDSTPDESQTG